MKMRRPNDPGRRHARVVGGRTIVLALLALVLCGNAHALQNFTGKVTSIEVTYMPRKLVFKLDAGNPACPAGKSLNWSNADLDNNKAVMAALATSMSTGLKVKLFIEDDDATCLGRYIYLVE